MSVALCQMQVDAGARIQLAKKDTIVAGTNERQVTITGSLDCRLKAISLIMKQMLASEGVAYQNQSTQYSNVYRAAAAAGMGIRPPPPADPYSHMRDREPAGGSTVLEISVPDSYIGGVVGRGGSVITNVQNTSGARIQISQKGVYMPGTTRRIITITGSQSQCDAAKSMITRIVEEQTGAHGRDSAAPREPAPRSYDAMPPVYNPSAAPYSRGVSAAGYGGGYHYRQPSASHSNYNPPPQSRYDTNQPPPAPYFDGGASSYDASRSYNYGNFASPAAPPHYNQRRSYEPYQPRGYAQPAPYQQHHSRGGYPPPKSNGRS